MKKYIALLLCGVLLLGVTACGKTEDKDKDSTATTQSTITTTVGEGSTTAVSGTTTTGTDGTQAPTTTTTGKKPTASTTTTTAYVPGGATVPIGTKPVTTTTTTKAPTQAPTQAPTGGETTATTVTTTTTKAPTTTVTKPTAKPLYISLPPVGTDIDVTNKKDRIHVTAVAAWQEDDGTIGVSLTFTNHSAKWITEETDYVTYACYDKNGKVLESAKVMIGCIDTKKNKEKTFYINVPANTAEVRLVKSKIVYWTEWS